MSVCVCVCVGPLELPPAQISIAVTLARLPGDPKMFGSMCFSRGISGVRYGNSPNHVCARLCVCVCIRIVCVRARVCVFVCV